VTLNTTAIITNHATKRYWAKLFWKISKKGQFKQRKATEKINIHISFCIGYYIKNISYSGKNTSCMNRRLLYSRVVREKKEVVAEETTT